MNSTIHHLNIFPTASPTLTWKKKQITRAAQSFRLDRDQSKEFLSNSQTDFSSNHLNRPTQSITRHESFQQTSTDLKSQSMADFNPNIPSKKYPNEMDQTIRSTSDPISSSEDEDDQEFLSTMKTFVDQGSQVILEELKPKKKKKTERSKKIKSKSKRAKILPTPPSTLLSSSPSRITSTGEFPLSTIPSKIAASITKNEENNGTKSIITVDTSKARSNLDVVRLCLRDLGWKEVQIEIPILSILFILSSVHIIQLSIQIFIGILHHSMKVLQIFHLILVE
jgi:hypothetical protein